MSNINDNSIIPIETLAALRALREAIPKLAEKLKPKPPPDHSGLILNDGGNDWGISMPGQQPVETVTLPSFPDTDLRYWKPIAVFDENGCITQLLLGRQRLVTVNFDLLLPLLKHLVRLDLAGTMAPVNVMAQVLDQCQDGLTHLYVGGNALGDNGFVQLVPHLPKTLCLLDVRYNDLGDKSAKALATFLQTSRECEKVYLEGNLLGNDGAHHLSQTGCVRELYLGQNQIGAKGATSLAEGLGTGQLEKLYLEGNNIGPAGAISFCKALDELGTEKKLKKLYVDNNEIGKTESVKLGNALQSNTMIGDSVI